MIDLFAPLSSIEHSMNFHLQRQAVLSSNVANAETPGYRALDMGFDAYMAQAELVRQTDPMHMGVGGSSELAVEVFEAGVAPGVDGNTVSMEREMAKISANSIRYKANVEIISRRLAMLKYAANDGRG